jgi:hypothetical protein
MAVQMTDDELLAQHIVKMGDELGRLFHALSEELSRLHWRWQQYRALFGEGGDRIDLLNQTAPFFFRTIHDVLFEDTLLGIARLVAGPKSAGNDNLTVQRIPALVLDVSLWDVMSRLVDNAKASADFAMQWRHRYLAHRDLRLSQNVSVSALPEATRAKVDEALKVFRQILDTLEYHYCAAHTAYNASVPGDARSLVYLLQEGLAREQEKHRAFT